MAGADLEGRLSALLADPSRSDDPAVVLLRELEAERLKARRRLDRIGRISDGYQASLRELNQQLAESNEKLRVALSEVKTLRGFLPICGRCKRIRNDEGYWDEVESYLGAHSDAVLSHGICPACASEGDSAPKGLPGPGPLRVMEEEVEERSRLEEILANRGLSGDPLVPEYTRLSRRFVRLVRRLEKIARISDGFQKQLKELNIVLQRLSRTDPLTGLANRREMLERLHAEANRSGRSGKSFVVAMLDIDRFKDVNDAYGHEAGDEVLRYLGALLRANLRSFDLCGRWGGEEFLVLLAETLPEKGLEAAEKLRDVIEQSRVPYAGVEIAFTVSVGVAVHEPWAKAEQTIREADAALYAAKREGRNRVMASEAL